jgi:hypothetical protein
MILKLALPDGPAEAEEFEVVRTLEHFIGLLGEMLGKGEWEVVRLLVNDGALVGAGLDLVEKDVARPAEAGGGAEVPEASGRIGEFLEDQKIVPPWNSGKQLKTWSFRSTVGGDYCWAGFWNSLSQNCRLNLLGLRRGDFWDSLSQK